LANMAWAFAKLNITNNNLMNSIADESLNKIRDFKSQALANMAWAFAVNNQPQLFQLLDYINHIFNHPDYNSMNLTQIYYASILLSHPLTDTVKLYVKVDDITISYSQRQIYDYIVSSNLFDKDDIQLEHQMIEHLSIDIAIPKHKIAIDVNGPSHYLIDIDGKKRKNGSQVLKEKIYEKYGWKVIEVDLEKIDDNHLNEYVIQEIKKLI